MLAEKEKRNSSLFSWEFSFYLLNSRLVDDDCFVYFVPRHSLQKKTGLSSYIRFNFFLQWLKPKRIQHLQAFRTKEYNIQILFQNTNTLPIK